MDCRKSSAFQWTHTRDAAAVALANGETQAAAAAAAGCSERTIRNWLAVPEFSEEVARLTLLTDIAHKAERVRLAKRIVRNLGEHTERDLLDWLKYIQGETEGVKLDLAPLLAGIKVQGG